MTTPKSTVEDVAAQSESDTLFIPDDITVLPHPGSRATPHKLDDNETADVIDPPPELLDSLLKDKKS